MIERANPRIHKGKTRQQALTELGFDDEEWLSIRSEEYKVHEKFTHHYQVLEKSYSVILPSPKTIRESMSHDVDKSILMSTLKASSTHQHIRIIQIIAENNQIMTRLIVTQKDPMTGKTTTFARNDSFLIIDGDIAAHMTVPHLLPSLIQLGKLISESQEDNAKEYIESLKTLGIID
jgi:hypothetical protein